MRTNSNFELSYIYIYACWVVLAYNSVLLVAFNLSFKVNELSAMKLDRRSLTVTIIDNCNSL